MDHARIAKRSLEMLLEEKDGVKKFILAVNAAFHMRTADLTPEDIGVDSKEIRKGALEALTWNPFPSEVKLLELIVKDRLIVSRQPKVAEPAQVAETTPQ